MKYEKEYGTCFDHLTQKLYVFEDDKNESLLTLLEDEYNTKVVDEKKFNDEMLGLIESMHEREIIKPFK